MSNGTVFAGRRYRISVGTIHNGSEATVIITDLACHVFINCKADPRTLNPTSRDQPIHDQRGRPTLTPGQS